MNRFTETLKNTLQPSPPALGFRPSSPSRKPHPLLMAGFKSLETGTEGADALIFNFATPPTLKTLKQAVRMAAGRPWGLFIKSDGKSLQQATKANADFVAFDPQSMDISILDYDNLGKVLVIDAGMDDLLLRAGSGLPFEAVILEAPKTFVSWGDLMYYRKIAAAATKPLLLAVAPDITQNGMQALWESGIAGFVVYPSGAGTLARLRQTIDSTTFTERGKGTKDRPVVPVIGGQSFNTPDVAPPDEGEEDDD